jgi:hypothetical protein
MLTVPGAERQARPANTSAPCWAVSTKGLATTLIEIRSVRLAQVALDTANRPCAGFTKTRGAHVALVRLVWRAFETMPSPGGRTTRTSDAIPVPEGGRHGPYSAAAGRPTKKHQADPSNLGWLGARFGQSRTQMVTDGASLIVVPGGGIEPPTRGFSIHCSTPELPGHLVGYYRPWGVSRRLRVFAAGCP